MLKGTSEALYRYREKCDRCFRLSDWLVASASEALMRCGDDFRSVFRAVRMLLCWLSCIAADAAEVSGKRKRLCRIFRCLPEEIAMDRNGLAENREQTRYYGGDFTYSAATPKEWIKNVQVIFGDAHLEALEEMACLGRLDSVWGSVYVSRCTDLLGLNLTIIKGDLHGEKLESANGLEKLAFVGGTIFYQDRQFSSLEEFRRSLRMGKGFALEND